MKTKCIPFATLFLFILFCGCGDKQLSSAGGSGKVKVTPPVINMLAWVGYEEHDFVSEVESKTGVRLNVKTYVGGDQMYSLLQASPNAYDIIVVDAEYGEKLFRERKLAVLSESTWKSPGLFRPFDKGEPAKLGSDVYAAICRWGALGLVYNTKHLTRAEVNSYSILWDKKVKGKVGIFDWYLPNMGVISKYGSSKRGTGSGATFSISDEQLGALKLELQRLRPNIKSIQPSTGDVIADLKSGDVWVTPGVGEWAAAALQEQGQPIDWIVPAEGGVMWVECLSVSASSKQKDVAEKVIKAIRDPQLLAKLAWRKAYVSQSPDADAYQFISDARKRLIRASSSQELQALIDKLEIRRLPGPAPSTIESDWLKVWNDFKVAQ